MSGVAPPACRRRPSRRQNRRDESRILWHANARSARARDRRLPSRPGVHQLRADVAAHAFEQKTLLRHGRVRRAPRLRAMSTPNLCARRPGGNIGVGRRVDIGIHAHRNAGLHSPPMRQRVDKRELRLRFAIENKNSRAQRLIDLGGCFADAGKDDLRRIATGLASRETVRRRKRYRNPRRLRPAAAAIARLQLALTA